MPFGEGGVCDFLPFPKVGGFVLEHPLEERRVPARRRVEEGVPRQRHVHEFGEHVEARARVGEGLAPVAVDVFRVREQLRHALIRQRARRGFVLKEPPEEGGGLALEHPPEIEVVRGLARVPWALPLEREEIWADHREHVQARRASLPLVPPRRLHDGLERGERARVAQGVDDARVREDREVVHHRRGVARLSVGAALHARVSLWLYAYFRFMR